LPIVILRLPAVKAITGLSRSSIYLRVAKGGFPEPVNLGGRAVGWVEAEVQAWLKRRVEASRPALGQSKAASAQYLLRA